MMTIDVVAVADGVIARTLSEHTSLAEACAALRRLPSTGEFWLATGDGGDRRLLSVEELAEDPAVAEMARTAALRASGGNPAPTAVRRAQGRKAGAVRQALAIARTRDDH